MYILIEKLLEVSKPNRHLEIGSYKGRSLEAALRGYDQMQVVSMDLYVNPRLKNIVKQHKIELRQGKSQKADWESLGKFDSIFIDGDHSYKGTLSDLRNCWNVWTKQGFFFGHDYKPKCGVVRAVNKFFGIDVQLRKDGRKIHPDEWIAPNIRIFKEPKRCDIGYIQVFGSFFVLFTEKQYDQYYSTIYETALKELKIQAAIREEPGHEERKAKRKQMLIKARMSRRSGRKEKKKRRLAKAAK